MQSLMLLVPGNIPGVIIVAGIIACFIGWCLTIVKWSQALRDQYEHEIIALKEVSFLVNSIHQSALTLPDDEQHRTLDYHVNQINHVFGEFCLSKTVNGKPLDPNSPVVAHVRTLFQAGMLESKVDTAEVLKNTIDRLFHKQIIFRNVLATFIVAGLLGTLIGLAESLHNLPGLLKLDAASGLVVQSNFVLKQAVDNLSTHLRSVFAPSIWGTGVTLLGMGVYMHCIENYCQPVKYALGHYTNSTWVPYLVPATTIKATKALPLAEIQLARNIEAADRAAEFAETLQHGVADLGHVLNKTNTALKAFAEYGDQMHLVVTTFQNSIGHVSGYQQEIQNMYGQFVSAVIMCQETLNESKGQIHELICFAQKTLTKNGDQIERMLAVLDRYEAYYMQEKRNGINDNKEMLAQTKRNLAALEERNREIIEAIGQPMVKNLTSGFNRVEDNLNLYLAAMVEKLGSMEPPMADTARLMSETLQAVERNMDRTLQSIMREATKQNEMIANTMKSIYQLSQNNNDLLAELMEGSGVDQTINVSQVESPGTLPEKIKECLVDYNGQANDQTAYLWNRVARIAAIVIITGLLGSFGYAQYKLIDILTEVQRTNEKLIMDMNNRQQLPNGTTPVLSPAVPASSSPDRLQVQQPGTKSKKN